MAEIGTVASVLQLASVTAKIVQYCVDVANAPAEADELMAECSKLLPLLLRLKGDPKLRDPDASAATNDLQRPIQDLIKCCEDVLEKIQPDSRLRKWSRDLRWPSLKKEAKEIMNKIARLEVRIYSFLIQDVKDLAIGIKKDTSLLPDISKGIQKTMSWTAQYERHQSRDRIGVLVDYLLCPRQFFQKAGCSIQQETAWNGPMVH